MLYQAGIFIIKASIILKGGLSINVTIEHLRCFKVMAETLNFTAAAQICHIAQPALSRMLASLEKEWQTQLFERSTRKVRLTPAGELCLARVSRLLREYDRLREELLMPGGRELSVGFNNATGPAPWLIAALRQMKEEFPQVKIHLHQIQSRESVFKIQSGELDCAVIYEHSAALVSGLRTKRLAQIHRHAVLSRSDELAQKHMVELSDLEGRHLIFMKSVEEITYTRLHRQMTLHGIQPEGETLVNSLTEMALQTELGGGIGITGLVSQYERGHNVIFVPLEGFEESEAGSSAALAWREDDNNPLITAFCEKLDDSTKDS